MKRASVTKYIIISTIMRYFTGLHTRSFTYYHLTIKAGRKEHFYLWHFALDVLSLGTEFSQYVWTYEPKVISLMEVERSPILIQIVVDQGLCTLLIRAPWARGKD